MAIRIKIPKRKAPNLSHPQQPPILPWISPLHYRSPPPSPSPPKPPKPPKSPKRFLSPSETLRLIKRQSSSPQTALDIFNSASLHPSFTPTPSLFSSLLLVLARHRLFPLIDHFLSQILPLHPLPFPESLLLSLLPFYSRSNPQRLLSLFHLILPLTRRKPSLKALATALNLLIATGNADLAQTLLQQSASKYGLHPNTCIHNILLKHHCTLAYLNTIPHPNVISYSTLMRAMCHQGKLKDAFDLFERMIERDGIVPDQMTYNVLIDGFCRVGQVEKGREVLGFMRRNGCEPNKFNYSALMGGFCREGKVEEARGVMEEMRGVGIEPDIITYTALVACLCKEGRVDQGFELVKKMKEKGVNPDVVTYNVIIEGLCKGRRIGEAIELLERLPFEGVKLNVASYRIVMNCLCGSGEMEKAFGLLGLMLGRGFVPHFAASNQLLVGLCEVGRVADATVALCGLAETGFCPEVGTWGRVVESVCRERKVRKAFELLDNLIEME